jgi:hypothetical protein
MRQGVLIKPYSISLNLSKSSRGPLIGSFGYPRAFRPTKVVALHGCGGFPFFYSDHAILCLRDSAGHEPRGCQHDMNTRPNAADVPRID